MVKYLFLGFSLTSALFWGLCHLCNVHNLGLEPCPHVKVPCVYEVIDL